MRVTVRSAGIDEAHAVLSIMQVAFSGDMAVGVSYPRARTRRAPTWTSRWARSWNRAAVSTRGFHARLAG